VAETVPPGRDPFQFGKPPAAVAAGPRRPRPAGAAPAGPTGEPKGETPMEVSGIVGFPGGVLAILNNQIVKAGDQVSGHRVERITDREVVLRTPEGGPRTVPLKDLTAAPAAGPRR
jgi:hypothetical protein